jgi:hypothetical protein
MHELLECSKVELSGVGVTQLFINDLDFGAFLQQLNKGLKGFEIKMTLRFRVRRLPSHDQLIVFQSTSLTHIE